MAVADLRDLTAKDFEVLIGEELEAAPSAGGPSFGSFRISEVQVMGSAREGMRQPFSVVFETSAREPVEQMTVWLRHARLGEVPVFVVPFAVAGSVAKYEAVFA